MIDALRFAVEIVGWIALAFGALVVVLFLAGRSARRRRGSRWPGS